MLVGGKFVVLCIPFSALTRFLTPQVMQVVKILLTVKSRGTE